MALISGCGSLRAGTPEWVKNPKAVYPETAYLASVGEGDSRRAAENAAAANLARIFEAHIESDERFVDHVRETDKSFERTTDFSADINILSAQTLYNIQHAEAWTDEKGRVHAVAYLDRRETAALYRDKIDQEIRQVHFLRTQAERTDNLLTRYANLRAAVRHAVEAGYLLRQLNIIHPASVSRSTPAYPENQLRKDLADAARQIRVRIEMDGDDERRMGAVLEELITRYGFVVGHPAVLEIDGRVAVNDTGQRTAGLVFVRYELAVQIKNASDTVLFSINEKGREGHVSLNEARIRALRTLENTLNAGGARRLDEYFDSLVEHMPRE